MLLCKYCNKECKNKKSLSSHQRWCPSNKERVYTNGMTGKKGTNQYTKGAKCSEETRRKIGKASKKQVWTEERRARHSIAMKRAVEKNPDSYTSSNRGRTKQIIFDGIKFQGTWELDYYRYCKSKNICIVRCTEGFHYEWNGSRTYYPDFYLPDHNVYVEVKGYKTERDLAKWKHFPNQLKVIQKADIQAIRKENDYHRIDSANRCDNEKIKQVPLRGEKLKLRGDLKWEPFKKLVTESGIDFPKFGWVRKVAEILDISPQKVNNWMKRHLPEFYEKECFKRKSPVIK